MRFLVDANILLDVLMNRQPHVTDSASIWKLCETGQAEGYISSLITLLSKNVDTNVQYTLSPLFII